MPNYPRQLYRPDRNDTVANLYCSECGSHTAIELLALEECVSDRGDIFCSDCGEMVSNLSTLRYTYLVDFNYVLVRKDNSKRES